MTTSNSEEISTIQPETIATQPETSIDVKAEEVISQQTENTLSLKDLPSGSYTLVDLREALKDISIEGEGELTLYDDIQKIESIADYEHAVGEVEFTFVLEGGNGKVFEKARILTIKEEPEKETEVEEEEKEKEKEKEKAEEKTEETKEVEETAAIDISDLVYDVASKKFTWKSSTSENLSISLNGDLLTSTVNANDQEWEMHAPDNGLNKVVFKLGEKTTDYSFSYTRQSYREVQSVMSWAGRRWIFSIFLDDNTFFDFNVQNLTSGEVASVTDYFPWSVSTNNKMNAMVQIYNHNEGVHIFLDGGEKMFGYGQSEYNIHWGEERSREAKLLPYAPKISAACLTTSNKSDAYFFLNDGTYLIYDQASQKITKAPTSTKDDWKLGRYDKDVTGCARMHDSSDYLLFLKGGKVTQFNVDTKTTKLGFPKLMEDYFTTLEK